MHNKILLVGINPAYFKSSKKSTTLRRLDSWLDYLGYKYVSFTNVLPEPGAYNEKMIDYDWVKQITSGYDKILTLGNFPSNALKKLDIDHFVLPHPSPLNRLLNSKEYEENKLKDCLKYLASRP
jgi:hypothetical protein